MKKRALRCLCLAMVLFLVTAAFTPAVMAEDYGNSKLNRQGNKLADELPEANESLSDKFAAQQLVGRLNPDGKKKFKERASKLISSTIPYYRDSYRINSIEVFRNDSKALKILRKFVGTGQNKLVDSATKRVYEADRKTAKTAIKDAKRVKEKLGIDSKKIERKIQKAEKAFSKAEVEAQKLDKKIKERVRAIKQYRKAWVHSQKALDALDKAIKPKIEITNKIDPPHNETITYTLNIRVFDVQPYELENATLYVNGKKAKNVNVNSDASTVQEAIRQATSKIKPGSNLTFSANVTLKKYLNKVKVELTDTDDPLAFADTKLSVVKAIAGPDLVVSFDELRSAIWYWANDETVPRTGGKKVSYMDLRKLFRMWKKNADTSSVSSLNALVKRTERKIKSDEMKLPNPPTHLDRSNSKKQTVSDLMKLDGDGLPDFYERKVTKTDPMHPDSDSKATSENEKENKVLDGVEDFDTDKLTTFREFQEESDPFSGNSDGDNLPDSFEVQYRNVSSFKSDTDGDGVSDHSDDLDSDGLTNLEEMKKDTSPIFADIDSDSLNDSREVDAGTMHNKSDTDKDGFTDPVEIELGTDPLSADTDGDGTEDANETYTTKKKDKSLGVSVEVTGEGNLAEKVEIQNTSTPFSSSAAASISDSPLQKGLVSPVINFDSESKFEKANITIRYNESKVKNESAVSVYRYNRSRQTFVPLNSTVNKDKNTVTATTPHFSSYAAIDTAGWHSSVEPPGFEEGDDGGGELNTITDDVNYEADGVVVTRRMSFEAGASPSVAVRLNKSMYRATGYLHLSDAKIDKLYTNWYDGSSPTATALTADAKSKNVSTPRGYGPHSTVKTGTSTPEPGEIISFEGGYVEIVDENTLKYNLTDASELYDPSFGVTYEETGSNPNYRINITEKKNIETANFGNTYFEKFHEEFDDIAGWDCSGTSSGTCENSGSKAVVTDTNDDDTTVSLEKEFFIPEDENTTLAARYRPGDITSSSTVSIKVVSESGETVTVFEKNGDEVNRNWQTVEENITEFAGDKVKVKIQATKAGDSDATLEVDYLDLTINSDPIFDGRSATGDFEKIYENNFSDGDISDWETEKWGRRNGEVKAKNEKMWMRVYKCHNVRATTSLGEHTGKIRITFDWRTWAEQWYEIPDWQLKVDGKKVSYNVVKGNDVNGAGGPGESSGGSVTVTAEVDGKVELVYSLKKSSYCDFGDHADTYFTVDNIEVSKGGGNVSWEVEKSNNGGLNKVETQTDDALANMTVAGCSAPRSAEITVRAEANLSSVDDEELYLVYNWEARSKNAPSTVSWGVYNDGTNLANHVDGSQPSTVSGYEVGRSVSKIETNGAENVTISFTVVQPCAAFDDRSYTGTTTFLLKNLQLRHDLVEVADPVESTSSELKVKSDIDVNSSSSTDSKTVSAQSSGGDNEPGTVLVQDKPIRLTKTNTVMYKDTDGDGISDRYERRGIRIGSLKLIHLNPRKSDTDEDGISDSEELNNLEETGTKEVREDCRRGFGCTWVTYEYYKMSSHPLKYDTDDDGLSDKKETEGFELRFIDNHDDAKSYLETVQRLQKNDNKAEDGDALTQSEIRELYESDFFNKPTVTTDPMDDDSDEDELTDGKEYRLKTNPNSENTDTDNMGDKSEAESKREDPTIYDITPPQIEYTTAEKYGEFDCSGDLFRIKELNIGVPACDMKGVFPVRFGVIDRNTGIHNVTIVKSGDTQSRTYGGETEVNYQDNNEIEIRSETITGFKWETAQDTFKGFVISLRTYDDAGNPNATKVASNNGITSAFSDLALDILGESDFSRAVIAGFAGVIGGFMYGMSDLVAIIQTPVTIPQMIINMFQGMFNLYKNRQEVWDSIVQVFGVDFGEALGEIEDTVASAVTGAITNQLAKSQFYENKPYLQQDFAGMQYGFFWVVGFVLWQALTFYLTPAKIAKFFKGGGRVSQLMSKLSDVVSNLASRGSGGLTRLIERFVNPSTLSRTSSVARGGVSKMVKLGDSALVTASRVSNTADTIVKLRRIRRIERSLDGADDIDTEDLSRFLDNTGGKGPGLIRDVYRRDDIDVDEILDPDYVEGDDVKKVQKAFTEAHSQGVDAGRLRGVIDSMNSLDDETKSLFVDVLADNPVNGVRFADTISRTEMGKLTRKLDDELSRTERVAVLGDFSMKVDTDALSGKYVDTDWEVTGELLSEHEEGFSDLFGKLIREDTEVSQGEINYFMREVSSDTLTPDQELEIIDGLADYLGGDDASDLVKYINRLDSPRTPDSGPFMRSLTRTSDKIRTYVNRAGNAIDGNVVVSTTFKVTVSMTKLTVKDGLLSDSTEPTPVLEDMSTKIESSSNKEEASKRLVYESEFVTEEMTEVGSEKVVDMWRDAETRDGDIDTIIKRKEGNIAYEVIHEPRSDLSKSEIETLKSEYETIVGNNDDIDGYKLVFTKPLTSGFTSTLCGLVPWEYHEIPDHNCDTETTSTTDTAESNSKTETIEPKSPNTLPSTAKPTPAGA